MIARNHYTIYNNIHLNFCVVLDVKFILPSILKYFYFSYQISLKELACVYIYFISYGNKLKYMYRIKILYYVSSDSSLLHTWLASCF